MIDDCWRTIHFPLSWDQFHELPRHPAYKHEYLDGQLWLTPRPNYFRALLRFDKVQLDLPKRLQDDVRLRTIRDDDWQNLAGAFSTAFWRVAPFDSLQPEPRLKAARECLQHTRTGADGPVIEAACFVAEDDRHGLCGAALVTLAADGNLCEWHSLRWQEPPPADCIEKRMGRPHLTWIFVSAEVQHHGIGTGLLARAVLQLREMGYHDLASTVMSHDDSSLLWHWRTGFELHAKPAPWRSHSI